MTLYQALSQLSSGTEEQQMALLLLMKTVESHSHSFQNRLLSIRVTGTQKQMCRLSLMEWKEQLLVISILLL